jgi:hypothetical protein
MSDNAPTNVTPTPPAAPAPAPAPAPTDPTLASMRTGFGAVLVLIAVGLLCLAAYYFYTPKDVAPATDAAEPTWSTYFKHPTVWPVAVWSLAFGLVSAGGAYVMITGLNRPDRDSPDWLAKAISFAFYGAGACLLALTVYVFVQRGFNSSAFTPLNLWAMLSACLLLVSGLLLMMEPSPQADRLRQFVLGTGLTMGALTFVLGVSLATITFYNDIGKGMATWQERPAVLIWPLAASLLGLGLAFFSVQPATPLIRTNQNLRRVVYGTNLAVTTLLLVLILVTFNVLAWAQPMSRFFGRSYDWTSTGFHALSPQTRNFVSGLRQPIKVYVVMQRGDPIANDVTTMLDNCRGLNSLVSYEVIEFTPRNRERVMALMNKYNLTDPQGLLVVSGTGEKGDYVFVKKRDLYEEDMNRARRGPPTYTFKGEGALLNALVTLTEGQMKIYFATGHGELSADAPMPPQLGKMPRGAGGELSTLRMRLTNRESVKVETLKIDRNLKEIPKDASLVVIARPREPFSDEEVAVLRNYLRRERKTRTEKLKDKGNIEKEVEEVTSGKLFLLLDPYAPKVGAKARVQDTGLEPLLTEYNVKLGKNRIMALRRAQGTPPDEVIAITDDQAANPIAKAFHPQPDQPTLFPFKDARTVEAAAPVGGKASVEPLLLVPPSLLIWASDDFDTSPSAQRQRLMENQAELRKMIRDEPLSLAVTVSDGGADPAMPKDAAHAMARKDTPRMVIFGSSSWITDEGLRGELGPDRVALFTTCVGWLQGSDVLGKSPEDTIKKRQIYNPNIKDENKEWLYRLPVWFAPLPMLLMVAMVAVIGAGVWVVRRR